MNFSKEWDDRFKENTHISIWPWSDLVSYVLRYARPLDHNSRILELGCGAGANIPFFNHLGVEYYAIEGSQTIVDKLWTRFPSLKKNIVVGDFTEGIPFDCTFDLIIDRAAVTSNTTKSIKRVLSFIKEKLKPNCKFIGIDWYSTTHSEYERGIPDEDIYTRKGYNEGQFAFLGRIHFSDKGHLIELFKDFKIERLEHKITKCEIPNYHHITASWNLIAVKD